MTFANLSPIPFTQVRVEGFFVPRIRAIGETTATVCLDQCEKTGRVANFRRAAGLEPGGFEGIYFNDSDVYKVLEGVAYLLMDGGYPALEACADTVIDAICAAQQPDGYIMTYYILNGLEKRWTDMGYHEAYCIGHMIEGAIAYHQATGKRKWLDTACKAVEHMMDTFGPTKRHWITGHQEIELALVKLFRHTDQCKYLEFAEWLVSERGHGHFDSPDFRRWGFENSYCQDDMPARELSVVTGHAVRAMYYYSGMADIAAINGDEEMALALFRLWDNVASNLYITGGIGQDSSNEGFTRDYHLPNLTAYCETCAAIGMALWNQRMNLMTGDGKYADLVERELYNGVLAGISLDGGKFFYDNPLASVGKYKRVEWFGCSCCPTNLIRFIPSIGGYAYAYKDECAYVNQFIAGDAEIGGAKLRVDTRYPYDGDVRIRMLDAGTISCLKIRVPSWCEQWTMSVNGQSVSPVVCAGYAEQSFKCGDEIIYRMELPVRFTRCDERVKENRGRVAVERGPIVYCAEEIDNPGIVREYFHADKTVDANASVAISRQTELNAESIAIGDTILIPYYAWNNRGIGAMCVWMKEKMQCKI